MGCCGNEPSKTDPDTLASIMDGQQEALQGFVQAMFRSGSNPTGPNATEMPIAEMVGKPVESMSLASYHAAVDAAFSAGDPFAKLAGGTDIRSLSDALADGAKNLNLPTLGDASRRLMV